MTARSQLLSLRHVLGNEQVELQTKRRKAKQSYDEISRGLDAVDSAIDSLDKALAYRREATPYEGPLETRKVVEIIQGFLEQYGVLPEHRLLGLVIDQVRQQGRIRRGLTLRFAEALLDPCFEISLEGYSLAKPTPTLPATPRTTLRTWKRLFRRFR